MIVTQKKIQVTRLENGISFKVINPVIFENSVLLEKNIKGEGFEFNISDETVSGKHFARIKLLINDVSTTSCLMEREPSPEELQIVTKSNKGLSSKQLDNAAISTYYFSAALRDDIREYLFGDFESEKEKTEKFQELEEKGHTILKRLGKPEKNANKYKKFGEAEYKKSTGNDLVPVRYKKGIK